MIGTYNNDDDEDDEDNDDDDDDNDYLRRKSSGKSFQWTMGCSSIQDDRSSGSTSRT